MEKCAVSTLSPLAQTQLACLEQNRNDWGRMAICTGLASLPPTTQKLVGCAVGPNARKADAVGMLACVGAANGSREADCLLKNRGDWQKAAICISARNLPAPVQAGLACAQKSSNATGFGVCMVASQGSGDAQRVAACYWRDKGTPEP